MVHVATGEDVPVETRVKCSKPVAGFQEGSERDVDDNHHKRQVWVTCVSVPEMPAVKELPQMSEIECYVSKIHSCLPRTL